MPIAIPPPAQPYNVNVPQAPNLLGMAQQAGTLRQMNQLLPLTVQEKQQGIQSGQLDIQQKQMQLASQQALMKAIASGDLNKFASSGGTEDAPGFDAAGAYQHLIQNGVLPEHAGQLVNQFQTVEKNSADIYTSLSDADKNKYQLHLDTHKEMIDDLAAVKDPNSFGAAIKTALAIPGLEPEVKQQLAQLQFADIPAFVQKMNIANELAINAQKQAEATKAGQEVAAPTDQQRQSAIATIAAYKAIPPEMQQAFAKEIQGAPTYTAQQKIQDRADNTNASFQRSADARTQAETMADVEKRKAVQLLAVKDDQDLMTKLQASQGIRGLLDMSNNGNQQATQAALVRFAEHEVVEGGVKRFNETELKALGSGTGTAWRQLEAWYDKGAKGKLPEMTNAEMGQILDMEEHQARSAHDQNISSLSSRMGVKLETGTSTAPSGAAKPTHRFNLQTGKIEAINAAP